MKSRYAITVLLLALVCLLSGCSTGVHSPPRAISGVSEVKPEVSVGSDGLTSEQRNVKERIKRDNPDLKKVCDENGDSGFARYAQGRQRLWLVPVEVKKS